MVPAAFAEAASTGAVARTRDIDVHHGKKVRFDSSEAGLTLRFLGANRQVTGSCHYLKTGGAQLLVDCGMFQERAFLSRNWEPSSLRPKNIDALFLTHAHIDHCGLVPKLVREGFRGPIHATHATAELVKLLLEDSARIQAEDAAYKRNAIARKDAGEHTARAFVHRNGCATRIAPHPPR